jgi:hypothetical protein
MVITLFDTSVCSENLGDQIIMDAIRENLFDLFPDSMFLNTPTHEKISKATYRLVSNSNYSFVGGSNLLSSNMNIYNQWKINIIDSFFLKNIILMGVGWWQYQNTSNLYTRYLLNKILNSKLLHSVRDSNTEMQLNKAGFNNVINTSCPTMWNLTELHCSQIPIHISENVVTTLTDYNKDYNNDLNLIKLLHKNYKKVYFWPQSFLDLQYFNELELYKYAECLPPNLKSFNNILKFSKSIDYVGTRLHAGIKALQLKKRSIIISIDNRAIEIAKNSNLVICPRNNLRLVENLIKSNFNTKIILPFDKIEKWKNQFK